MSKRIRGGLVPEGIPREMLAPLWDLTWMTESIAVRTSVRWCVCALVVFLFFYSFLVLISYAFSIFLSDGRPTARAMAQKRA